MKVTTKKVKYKNFSCVEVSNGVVSAIVTIDCGPRIIFFGFKGGVNHLAVLEDGAKKGDSFVHYGGHRLWLAPERETSSYIADNDAVEYGEGAKGASFTATNGDIQKLLHLEFVGDNALLVHNRIINRTNFPLEVASWGITNFDVGGLAVVPMPFKTRSLTSNGALALWSYTSLSDKRLSFGENFMFIRQTDDPRKFKVGIKCEGEFCAYFNHNEMVIKNFAFEEGKYPNYDCNFECFTNDKFIELECLSTLKTVEVDESVEHSEVWEIYKDIEMPKAEDEAVREIFIKHLQDYTEDDSCSCGCGHNHDCDCDDCDDCDHDCDCDDCDHDHDCDCDKK